MSSIGLKDGTYDVDPEGSLVKPEQWNARFARSMAARLGMEGRLSDRHWQIVVYLRDAFRVTGLVPTVDETCEANDVDLKELARLFPGGGYRGAVKIAGLRVQ